MMNKKGGIYGLKFLFEGQTFKASEIGREFGYNSLLKQFGLSYAASYQSSVLIYQPKVPLQKESYNQHQVLNQALLKAWWMLPKGLHRELAKCWTSKSTERIMPRPPFSED